VRAYSRRAWQVAISLGGLWRAQQPNGVWPSGSRHGQPSMAPGGNGGPPNGISGSCLGRWQPEHDEDAGRLEIGRRRAKNLVGLRRRTRVPLRPDHLQARPRPAGRRRGDPGVTRGGSEPDRTTRRSSANHKPSRVLIVLRLPPAEARHADPGWVPPLPPGAIDGCPCLQPDGHAPAGCCGRRRPPDEIATC
jgi:hypothetical protein